MIDLQDIVGTRTNYLTVLSHLGKFKRYQKYRCKCDCGKILDVLRHALCGKYRQESCGCIKIKRERLKVGPLSHAATHGLSKTSIYTRWREMMNRCYSQNSQKYHRYGARGIAVCDRWHDFECFFKDVGHPPGPGMSIDRIDVNGNYTRENCRWATQKTQQNNRQNTRIITANGITRKLTEWAEICGVSPNIIRQRIDRDGLTPEEAMGLKLDEVINR